MGKAIAISVAVVLIVAIIAFVVRRNFKDSNTAPEMGDYGLKQEREMRQLLDEAGRVMAGLGVGTSIDDSDVISARSRIAIDKWARRYNSYQQREIDA